MRETAKGKSTELTPRQLEIIDAAVEVLDEKGYNELSIRDIAKKTGIKAPAIYWHFDTKEILLDYMAERFLTQAFGELTAMADGENWQAWLTAQILTLRRAMLMHRDGGRIVAGANFFPAVTLAQLNEKALESLVKAGLPIEEAVVIVVTAIRFTFGYVIEEQADSAVPKPTADDSFERGRLPYLQLALTQQPSSEAIFKAGLRRIIGE